MISEITEYRILWENEQRGPWDLKASLPQVRKDIAGRTSWSKVWRHGENISKLKYFLLSLAGKETIWGMSRGIFSIVCIPLTPGNFYTCGNCLIHIKPEKEEL